MGTFGQKTAATSKKATNTNTTNTNTGDGGEFQPAEDHYADVTEMETTKDGKTTTSKFVKFVQDVSDGELFIPKGTIFTFETYEDIHARTPNPSDKMLAWLNKRITPFTTPKGAKLTGFGMIKRPYKPNN